MHELALAEGILDIVREYAEERGAARVSRVGLLLGELTGVEETSLAFAFEALARGTPAEGAALAMRRVPLLGRCADCGRERRVEAYTFLCPRCGGVLELVSGRELRVEYLEME